MRWSIAATVLALPLLAACHDATAPSIYKAHGAWFSVSLWTGDAVLKPPSSNFPPGTVNARAALTPGTDVFGRTRRAALQALVVDGAPHPPRTMPTDAAHVWEFQLTRADERSTDPLTFDPPAVAGLARKPGPITLTMIANGGSYVLPGVAQGEAIRLPVRLPATESTPVPNHRFWIVEMHRGDDGPVADSLRLTGEGLPAAETVIPASAVRTLPPGLYRVGLRYEHSGFGAVGAGSDTTQYGMSYGVSTQLIWSIRIRP